MYYVRITSKLFTMEQLLFVDNVNMYLQYPRFKYLSIKVIAIIMQSKMYLLTGKYWLEYLLTGKITGIILKERKNLAIMYAIP